MTTYHWDRHAIKAEICRRCGTLSAFAHSQGIKPSSVRAALLKPSPTANRAIAKMIGVPLHQLWPAWFDAYGARKRKGA